MDDNGNYLKLWMFHLLTIQGSYATVAPMVAENATGAMPHLLLLLLLPPAAAVVSALLLRVDRRPFHVLGHRPVQQRTSCVYFGVVGNCSPATAAETKEGWQHYRHQD